MNWESYKLWWNTRPHLQARGRYWHSKKTLHEERGNGPVNPEGTASYTEPDPHLSLEKSEDYLCLSLRNQFQKLPLHRAKTLWSAPKSWTITAFQETTFSFQTTESLHTIYVKLGHSCKVPHLKTPCFQAHLAKTSAHGRIGETWYKLRLAGMHLEMKSDFFLSWMIDYLAQEPRYIFKLLLYFWRDRGEQSINNRQILGRSVPSIAFWWSSGEVNWSRSA